MPTVPAPACSTSSSAAPALRGGLVSEAEYAQQVALAKLFLAGKNQQVIGELVGRWSPPAAICASRRRPATGIRSRPCAGSPSSSR